MAGVVVQLTALWALSQLRALPYLAAVALAIEISLLHNFAWHEVWTWRGLAIEQRWLRLLRFQLGNGLVSLAGNTFFTWLFHQFAGWPLLLSNAAAICCTSILNFVVAAGWVFRPSAADGS
jgi:putative flippase GtrA